MTVVHEYIPIKDTNDAFLNFNPFITKALHKKKVFSLSIFYSRTVRQKSK